MKGRRGWLVGAACLVGLLALGALAFYARHATVLQPQGLIASQEKQLLVFATLLSLVVVLPVFVMTFGIVWKYRAGNKNATYMPDWDHSHLFETLWWGIPCVIIIILGVVTWKSSHDLDPFRPLNSTVKPLKIQVVALQWKWLFIYPEQRIATVNYIQFPEKTPIDFEITADAPMNSFWIPALGGQIYAMSGMSTQVHLMADKAGSYRGSSANISGKGFAGMKFVAESASAPRFAEWVKSVKQKNNALDSTAYGNLAAPSEDQPITHYSSAQADLYDTILMKYMGHMSSNMDSNGEHMSGAGMMMQ